MSHGIIKKDCLQIGEAGHQLVKALKNSICMDLLSESYVCADFLYLKVRIKIKVLFYLTRPFEPVIIIGTTGVDVGSDQMHFTQLLQNARIHGSDLG
jgi:hypothetical protein